MTKLSLLSLLLLSGCGGTVATTNEDASSSTTDSGTPPGTDGSTPPPTDTSVPSPFDVGTGPFDFCKELGNRASKCGDGFDPTGCKRQLACYDTIVRPTEKDGLLRCFVSRDCGISDDKCVASVAAKYTSDPGVSEYVKTCNEKRTACMGGFADDHCGFDHGILTDEWRNKMRACLDQPCAAIADCFRTVIASAGCKG